MYKTSDEKKYLLEFLINGIVTITFTKNNGDTRILYATLDEDRIPFEKLNANRKSNEYEIKETQTVFDIEKQDWRSFRWDSIKSVTLTM